MGWFIFGFYVIRTSIPTAINLIITILISLTLWKVSSSNKRKSFVSNLFNTSAWWHIACLSKLSLFLNLRKKNRNTEKGNGTYIYIYRESEIKKKRESVCVRISSNSNNRYSRSHNQGWCRQPQATMILETSSFISGTLVKISGRNWRKDAKHIRSMMPTAAGTLKIFTIVVKWHLMKLTNWLLTFKLFIWQKRCTNLGTLRRIISFYTSSKA